MSSIKKKLILSSYKPKEDIGTGTPTAQASNVIVYKFLCARFRVTVNIFRGPAPSLKVTLKCEILELESRNNLAQLAECPFFLSSNITAPY